MAVDIAQLLAFAVKSKASDLHLSAGVPPMIRVDGDVKRINMPALAHKDVHSMVYDIMNDKQRKDYEEFLETDFSFEIPKLARFRVNAYNQMRGAGAVFRTIPSIIQTLEISPFSTLHIPSGAFTRIAEAAEANNSNGSNPQPMDANAYLSILRSLS